MSAIRILRTMIALVLMGMGASGIASEELVEQARSVTTRALPFLKQEGEYWRKEEGCVSCHQVPFMLWSAATLDSESIGEDWWNEQFEWSRQWRHWMKPGSETDREKADAANVDTMAQLLLAGVDRGVGTGRKAFQRRLFALQQDDGSWQPGGQLPLSRRPEGETQAATTMWVLWALQRTRAEPASLQQASDRAKPFLRQVTSGVSTEWWAVRLLETSRRGEPTRAAIEELLERRNPDGGWGWLVDEPSDALGTGIALYALAQVGASSADLGKTIRYLVESQDGDGQWSAPSTRRKDKGRVKDTSIYWGTAWSVIGLASWLEAQPDERQP